MAMKIVLDDPLIYSDGDNKLYKERHLNTQTLCSDTWPFNGVNILGTYCHSIY